MGMELVQRTEPLPSPAEVPNKGAWGLVRSMPTRRWASEISVGITGTASMQGSRWRSIWNIPQLPLRRVALSLLGSDMDAGLASKPKKP